MQLHWCSTEPRMWVKGGSAAYIQLPHTRCCLWLQITCQLFHLMCQLAWLAPSLQCKWACSAASWQSRAFSKRMVQTWHTFKKFSLPSANPLLHRRGWHVPNEIGGFVWENPPSLTGIVSSKTTPLPFLGKSCNFYPCLHHCCLRKYFISRNFHSPWPLFWMQRALRRFVRILPKSNHI